MEEVQLDYFVFRVPSNSGCLPRSQLFSFPSFLSPCLPACLAGLLPLPFETDPIGIPAAFCYFLVRQRSRINPRITTTKSSKDFHQRHVVRVVVGDISSDPTTSDVTWKDRPDAG